jgi:putative ABC transport system permease protein
MITFYLKSAIRYIRSNKISSTLNIIGLSVTFAIFVLLGSYVVNELSVGSNIPGNEKIYRVQPKNGSTISYKAYELLTNIPGVNSATHLMETWSMKQNFVYNEESFGSGKILYATSNFFEVFPYKPIFGNLENALNSPDGIVLTQSLSRKIFGSENTIGEKLTFRSTNWSDFEYHVSAVIEDLPQNDMLKFSCIMPHQSLNKFNIDSENWGDTNYEAYITLNENAQTSNITNTLNSLFKQNAPDWMVEDVKELSLNPFRDLYFDNSFEEYILEHNNKSSVWSMAILALIILLAGGINFINLSTAQKEKKRKSIAVSHTNGASKLSMYIQFLTETVLEGVISLAIAVALVAITSPFFNHLNGQSFPFHFFLQFIFSKGYWVIPLVLTIASGVIIAVYFQSGKYHLILKNNKKGKEYFRTGLLVTQFMVSIMLIIGSLAIQKQNRYMLNRPTGFQKDGIICVPLIGEIGEHTSALGDEFLKIPGVKGIAYASEILGQEDNLHGMSISNEGEDKRVQYSIIQVDSGFFSLMGLKIIEGPGFKTSSDREKDHIFNQTALKEFGIANINKARVSSYSNAPGNIVGIVQDFNYLSFHSPIKPMAFVYKNPENLGYAYLKLSNVSSENINTVLKKAGNIWKQFVPDWPFEYYFLDQALAILYEKDQNFAGISFALTILAVFIACLGLFGITMFLIESKIKEIGIRKVNGAKVSEILTMLNKDFVKWVAIAFVIATPVAWYAMNKWLENFAYKTTLSWWIFALAGLLALGIALLTVSWQSWRAATRNPVEALRYE